MKVKEESEKVGLKLNIQKTKFMDNMPANLENSAVATGLEKVSFHPNPKERQWSNYCTIALISHTSKVMLKILQARLQQYMNCELPDVQDGFFFNFTVIYCLKIA